MKKLLLLMGLFYSLQSNAQILGNWNLAGPTAFPENIVGQINGMGRISQIKFSPLHSNRMYAVAATGGLWISDNSGTTWHNTGTDALPVHDFANVCIDYTNDSILYLGGGDANYYHGSLYAIWKTTDGGATWNHYSTGIGSRLVVELLMSPDDHNELIAATSDGVFKSYDGGQTWSEKLSTGDFTDMAYKTVTGTHIIFAVTHSKIYRSEDLGETWNELTNGITIPNNDGEGMRLAVTPADTNRVYVAMIANRGNVLRSDDGGDSWTTVKDDYNQSLVGYSEDESGQGNYDFTLIAHPQHPDWLFLSAHCHWRSLDGGVTWTKLTNWWTNCHTDMHDYEFDPNQPNRLFNANDGGVWVSTDTGNHWSPSSDFLSNTEFYHAANSNLNRGYISGGTQDNGELYMGNGTWYTNRGGDWTTPMAFDYLSSDYCYEISDGTKRGLTGGSKDLNLPFTPDNKTDFEFTPDAPGIAFVSQNDVWRSDTLASNQLTWNKISNFSVPVMDIEVVPGHPDWLYVLTNNKRIYRSFNALDPTPTWGTYTLLPNGTNLYASIATIGSDTNVVYMSGNNKIYRSGNKGASWVDVSYNLPSTNIKKVVADEYSSDESVYALVGNTVYYKNNTMNSWINYSFGMPTVAEARDLMIFNNGTANSALRVSFFGRGVWESPLYSTPVCSPVDSLFASDITMSSAIVHWASSGSGNYVLQYKALTEFNWNAINVSGTSYPINGLDPDTKYAFRVQSTCTGNTQSGFSLPANFKTDCEPVPAQWAHQDIGQVQAMGNVCYTPTTETYRMIGSGEDIWGQQDECQYMYQQVKGDVTITAYCESMEDVYGWAKAGPMIRETLDSNARQIMMAITPGNGAAVQYRKNPGGNSSNTNDTSFHAPLWLRMARTGSSFTGSVSADGSNWTDIKTTTISMGDTAYAGLAHTSHIDGVLSESVFKFITITPDSAIIPGSPTGIPVRSSTQNWFTLYPNPTTGHLQLAFTATAPGIAQFSIYNVQGVVVKQTTIAAQYGFQQVPLHVNELPEGLYIVKLRLGENTQVRQLVIAR